LNEIVYELRFRKQEGLLLKLDFEKAYDMVNWYFLREILFPNSFYVMMVHRMMQLVKGDLTAINVNREIGHFFRNTRGCDREIRYHRSCLIS
jgi:hypothetical protein